MGARGKFERLPNGDQESVELRFQPVNGRVESDVLWSAPEYPHMGPDIFDTKADGVKLIEAALVQARQEDKRVIVLFGANWCPWCRRLHLAFTSTPTVRQRIQQKFVLVYIDANMRNDRKRNAAVIERYGNPLQHGIPVFVVLDREGTQLTTRESQSLAAATDEATAGLIRAFLDKWAK